MRAKLASRADEIALPAHVGGVTAPRQLITYTRRRWSTPPAPRLERSRTLAWLCLASALVMLLGAIGPWVRVGPFALSGFEGVGLPLAALAGLAVGLSALQLSTQRRSLFVVLAILGVLVITGCAIVWTLLKVFSGSAHLLSVVLAGGAHRAAFESHAPTAAWGLWLLPLSAASLAVSAFAGSAMRAAPRGHAPIPSIEPPTTDVFPPVPSTLAPGGATADRPQTRWR